MSQISDRFLMVESKRRSAPASTKFSRISPIGSSTALPGEIIRFRFPTGSQGRFMDTSQSFISFTVTSSVTTTGMSCSGAGGFFRTSLVRSAGNHLTSIENYQLYRNLYTKQHCSADYLSNDGAVMCGTSTNLVGEITLATVPRAYVDFLSNFSSFFSTDRMIPLSTNSPIEWDLTLGSIDSNFLYTNDAAGNAHVATGSTALVFSDIMIHACLTDVPMEVDRTIMNMVDYQFREILYSTLYSPFFAASGGSNFIFQLGMSCSSLSKLDVCFTEPTTISTIPFNVLLKKGLASARVLIDGIPHLAHGISGTNAIALAYNRVADHSLNNINTFQSGSAVDFNATGYWISFDFEAIAKKGSELRSGLNVSTSTVVLELTFAAALTANLNVHCFSSFDALVSADFTPGSGSRDWELSI